MSTYDRELVEKLLPTVWDQDYCWGMVNEYEPDPHMPKSKSPKNQTHTLWAHLADVRMAWQHCLRLTIHERKALVLVGGIGMTYTEAGRYFGSSRQSATEAFEVGVGKLMDYLNKTAHYDDEDDETE